MQLAGRLAVSKSITLTDGGYLLQSLPAGVKITNFINQHKVVHRGEVKGKFSVFKVTLTLTLK